ncbi:MAG: hypothetical protein FJ100_18195, partial [Deltaproteobacteria bacterium]|nr:hypothetical protein [Deltaproteobacteria bacterium]
MARSSLCLAAPLAADSNLPSSAEVAESLDGRPVMRVARRRSATGPRAGHRDIGRHMNTVVRIGTAAAAVAALAMTAAGCRKGSDPVPAPVALVDAAAASSATSAPGAWPDPLAAPPTAATATAAGPVQRSVARAVVATAKTAAVACAAPSSAGLWLALADDRGLTVRELSAAATPTDAGVVVATAQRPTALHCGSGAQAFWLSADRGRTVAVVARGVVRPVPARASVHGLVAQSDGAAVLAASSADTDKVELVRLTPQLEPVWQREVPVPGEVTAVTATLRDDVVLVGRKPTATGPVWWLLRAGQRDGAVAW